jgi:hypothetical protein
VLRARVQTLNSHDIELLWASSVDKHESLVRVVYDTVAELASSLSAPHLEALYKRISTLPLDKARALPRAAPYRSPEPPPRCSTMTFPSSSSRTSPPTPLATR